MRLYLGGPKLLVFRSKSSAASCKREQLASSVRPAPGPAASLLFVDHVLYERALDGGEFGAVCDGLVAEHVQSYDSEMAEQDLLVGCEACCFDALWRCNGACHSVDFIRRGTS